MIFRKKKQNHNLTEGEEIVKEYLDLSGFDYEEQKEIKDLKGDSYNKRVADFYLPKYKVYVEFEGGWNKEKYRERYLEKWNIYKDNKIPCVYIYPDNLGFIDKIFKRRLKKVLQDKPEYKKELFKLNSKIFIEFLGWPIILFAYLIYSIPLIAWKVVFGLLAINQIVHALKNSFFKRIEK